MQNILLFCVYDTYIHRETDQQNTQYINILDTESECQRPRYRYHHHHHHCETERYRIIIIIDVDVFYIPTCKTEKNQNIQKKCLPFIKPLIKGVCVWVFCLSFFSLDFSINSIFLLLLFSSLLSINSVQFNIGH